MFKQQLLNFSELLTDIYLHVYFNTSITLICIMSIGHFYIDTRGKWFYKWWLLAPQNKLVASSSNMFVVFNFEALTQAINFGFKRRKFFSSAEYAGFKAGITCPQNTKLVASSIHMHMRPHTLLLLHLIMELPGMFRSQQTNRVILGCYQGSPINKWLYISWQKYDI